MNKTYEEIDQYLEPLCLVLLSLYQNHIADKYIEIIGKIKNDERYKDALLFHTYVRSQNNNKLNLAKTHLDNLKALPSNSSYNIEKLEEFYNWRKINQ